MILGNIIGKTSTMDFSFLVKYDVNKFDYVQVPFKEIYVLAQILEIEKTSSTIAKCNIIGYREDEKLKQLLSPLEPGAEVLKADEDFIKEVLDLREDSNSAFIGSLQRYENLKVYLDLNKLLTKHVSILAKSGSGKSYIGGVLVEEILDRDIPLIIIDPHGEYSSLNKKSDDENLIRFGLKPKDYSNKIKLYSPNTQDNPECIPLKLSNYNLSSQEILHVLPAKLSNVQLGLLYSSLKEINKIDFNQLILGLELEENPAKYTLINIIKYLSKLNLFSDAPTSLQELIHPGKCSIINLKGVDQELQEVVVYKLVKDLFEERKKGNIPPFFLIIEEAHNYLPERSFGEAKSSKILRQVASEGRKFGLGLCLHPETKIQCNPRIEEIKSLEINNEIVTYNLDRNLLESEKIVNIIKVNPKFNNLKVFKLSTETGRSIIGSEEHPLLTKQGWKTLKELNDKDFVAVYPTYNLRKIKNSKKNIINKGEIKKTLEKYIKNNKKVWSDYNHIEILKKLKEYPSLKQSNNKSLILARMVGHILSDGCIKSNKKGVTFYLDSIIAAEEVKKDLKLLGVSYGKTEKIIGNWGTEYRVETTVKPFWVLMVSLGCPIGKKSKVSFLVPKWIKKGSKEIKREFLSALFGGDGAPSGMVSSKTRKISYFCFSKSVNLEKNGVYYANELKNLFGEFGINTTSIKLKKHEKRIAFELRFGSERRNTIKLFEEIGIKYSYYKKKRVNSVLEYMKYQEMALEKRKKKIKEIKELYKNKISINKITKIVMEDWHFVEKVVRNNYKVKINKRKDVISFNEWIKEREFKEGLILEKIIKKEEIDYKGELLDIETEKNHNFLANSFLTHNCVISQRPSRLDKSVISQCSTQIILKVTNPNDLRALANSVEGLTSDAEKEIINLSIGTALITGVAELPLFVDIRPRMTKHGGEAVDMLNITSNSNAGEKGELLQVIKQKTSKKDLELLGHEVNVKLIPCLYIQSEEHNLLINLNNGKLINNLESGDGKDVIKKIELSPQQKRVFDFALSLKEFTAAELFSKSGVQFSEIYDIINILVEKGYFIKDGSKYCLSNVFNLDFNEFNIYENPDYHKVEGEKLKKNFNNHDIINFLKNFLNIKNEKECWLEVFS